MRGWIVAASAAILLAGCGAADAPASSSSPAAGGAVALNVQPTITELLTGTDLIGLALFDHNGQPVEGAKASVEVTGIGGVDEHRPLSDIGPEYGGIPVYTGAASFPQVGVYRLAVTATLAGGGSAAGTISVRVTQTGPGVPIGARVPAVSQPILGDPGVTIGMIDSGDPPDPFHTATVAQALAAHKPMVLYFGEPGYCTSHTCGPTVEILEEFAKQYGGDFDIEHIENNYPAGPGTAHENPAFTAFGLASDPWIYFVNAQGVVADRFEGPVTVTDLDSAAEGTLAGHVPAVVVSLNS